MWGLTWKGKESKGKLVQTGQKDYIGNWGNDYLNGLGRGGTYEEKQPHTKEVAGQLPSKETPSFRSSINMNPQGTQFYEYCFICWDEGPNCWNQVGFSHLWFKA